MKNIIENNRTRVSTLMLALSIVGVIALGTILQSCNNDEEQPLDEAIINSSELEEYIIAGADFQKSLADFKNELNKIDFSKLEVTYDADGRKIIHLPASVTSILIEDKIQTFNEKKGTLLRKFPQFSSFREDIGENYFQQCIQNSSSVNSEFLKLGINTSRSRLKSGSEQQWYGEDWYFFTQHLSSWMNTPNYVEVSIMAFADGTYMTYVHPNNTPNHAYISVGTSNGYHYFEGYQSSPMVWYAHTHQNSSNPGKADSTFKNDNPNMGHYIYYQGGFYSW